MRFTVDLPMGDVPIGHYELNPFPGSNQIVVSSHAFIKKEYRGNGHGRQAALDRIVKARELDYDYMLCTVRADNEPQLKIIRSIAGWDQLDNFTSKVSDVEVFLFGISL